MHARRKVGGAILLLTLIATSILATLALSSINNIIPQPFIRAVVLPPKPEYGVLFLDVLLGVRPYNNFTPLDLPAYFTPMPFEAVSIMRTDQRGPIVPFETNYTGLLRLLLPVSDKYQLVVNDSRFLVTVPFSIQSGEQTNVVVKGNRDAYLATFQESVDSFSSGWITPSSGIFLRVLSERPLPNNSTAVFLETERATGISRTALNLTASRSITQTRLQIISQEQETGQLWLSVSPTKPVALAGLVRVFVVKYSPSFTVTFGTSSG